MSLVKAVKTLRPVEIVNVTLADGSTRRVRLRGERDRFCESQEDRLEDYIPLFYPGSSRLKESRGIVYTQDGETIKIAGIISYTVEEVEYEEVIFELHKENMVRFWPYWSYYYWSEL